MQNKTRTYLLPWPPSTNALWRAFRGRNILSRQARLWAESAEKELRAQRAELVPGPVEVHIALCAPHKRRYDLDNRIKAVLDLLVKQGLIEDDGHAVVRKIIASVGDGFQGAKVTIHPV